MKKEKVKKICIGVFIIFVMLFLTYIIGKPILSLISDEENFKELIAKNTPIGELIVLAISIIQVVFALIPSEALELCSGYAFGWFKGTLICLIGISIGSSIVIYLTQKFGRKFVNLFYSDEKIDSIKLFKNEKKLGGLIFLIFLIPGTPKDLVTYVVGLTRLKISTYLLLTTIARTPSILISTLAGSAFASNEYNQAILFFILSVATGILGFFVYKIYFDRQEKRAKK